MNDSADEGTDLRVHPSEHRAWEIARELPGTRIVCISLGRGQAAQKLAQERTDATVTSWFLDAFHAALAAEHYSQNNADWRNSNLELVCQADWPGTSGPCEADVLEQSESAPTHLDLAVLPIRSNGESELNRELLQAAYANLTDQGHLVAAVDNPKDRWLHDQMKVFDKSVKVRPFDDAVVYFVQKSKPLKRVRDFRCELSFRDEGRLTHLVTRPGVFSHRQLDNGARQILDLVEVFPEARLLDIGCGSGSIALALAAREASASVTAIDSSGRAVWCTQAGAVKNGLNNVVAMVNHDGVLANGPFDMALANPPYYGDFRIAQHFIQTAFDALRTGGRLMVVSKQPRWYEENLGRWMKEGEVFQSRRYHIATGIKP